MKKTTYILSCLLFVFFALSGCASYTCAPSKQYHEPWVQTGKSYPTVESCVTSIWAPGVCAGNTPMVADMQIKWGLECAAYCREPSKERNIKSCAGVSMDRNNGKALCKQIAFITNISRSENPWHVICSELSSTCECRALSSDKKSDK